ncbi:hypothetical protein [Nocardioides marmotae]|uniref:hypothetical protein n=1 Tax=Nocardioides marmotae TaxID=2663857 RepID=UPI0012B520FA|nr:hypothetical protein [Nocardioides marmotae]MBC9734039.1 hypothetical protein [Nocardioides marmotae]MTB85142.1 hypothetical protein [Nocardioides marmotae]
MPSRIAAAVVLTAGLLLGLGACGSGSEDPSGPAPAGAGGDLSGADVAAALEQLPTVTGLVPLRRGDLASLPGAPTDFVEGWTVRDRRFPCEQPGIECGAEVEVWGSPDSAARRSEEIRTLQLGTVDLGTETHLLAGPVLLRLDGALTRAQVAAYRAALEDAGATVSTPEPLF